MCFSSHSQTPSLSLDDYKPLTLPFKELYRRATLITSHYLNLNLLTCVTIVAFLTFTAGLFFFSISRWQCRVLSEPFLSSFPLMVPCRSNPDSWCVNYLCHFIFFFFLFQWAIFLAKILFLTRHERSRHVNGCLVRINSVHVRSSVFPVFLVKIKSPAHSNLLHFLLILCLAISLSLCSKWHACSIS